MYNLPNPTNHPYKGNNMIKFITRSKARAFAAKSGRKIVDLGADTIGSRWAVKIV